jgi:hypothetical protein
VAWGVGLPLVGYFLGNLPFVERHVELIVLAIACLSAMPVIISAAKALVVRARPGAARVTAVDEAETQQVQSFSSTGSDALVDDA